LARKEFEGILNRDDAFIGIHHFQKLAAELGFASRGSARNNDIQPL
jgi:hypothetical protein